MITKVNIWDGQGTHLDQQLKNTLLDFICRMQDEKCLLNSTNYFQSIPKAYFQDSANNQNP